MNTYCYILLQECPECRGKLAGRNTTMENIAAIVFSQQLQEQQDDQTSEGVSDIEEDTKEGDKIPL